LDRALLAEIESLRADRDERAKQKGNLFAEMDRLRDDNARLRAARLTGLGVPLGVHDRNGNQVHIGDTLRFDEKEWGEPMAFVVELRRGEIHHPGATSDLSEYCEIIKRWDS